MWISWHYLDPIMKDLGKLPEHTEIIGIASERVPYSDYSTITKTLYSGSYKEPYSVSIKTIEQFNQVLLLASLGILEDEIQQQIDLGTTDDT